MRQQVDAWDIKVNVSVLLYRWRAWVWRQWLCTVLSRWSCSGRWPGYDVALLRLKNRQQIFVTYRWLWESLEARDYGAGKISANSAYRCSHEQSRTNGCNSYVCTTRQTQKPRDLQRIPDLQKEQWTKQPTNWWLRQSGSALAPIPRPFLKRNNSKPARHKVGGHRSRLFDEAVA
ncbi:hypothetical protein MPH_04960 [Macrophomina phaseolina MS6]|uniref:Uncharacterized protein n=1 Tax=Macrophomina phaseolina (strain MS6) TaxID=1126212 RepID=K2RSV5_MACPH|nr:hypothetical protein MPH_04960 [Macrophomina phaseolina MS6]